MIPVSKPYLPNREKVDVYLDSIYETNWLTNNGPLVQKLSTRLSEYLGIDSKCLVLVANGSLALHLAYKALNLSGEAITTPFSYIATASTLKWEGITPVFSDINPNTWNIDPEHIEEKITSDTTAIVPVHVFGNPCDVHPIQRIADKYNLKVIYDASHCFGIELKGKSILEYGDISTISFHATKLFHAAEGGAVITKTPELANKVRQMINFGFDGLDSISMIGTNTKMSEFHAAVGLAVLDDIELIKQQRANLWNYYAEHLATKYQLQERNDHANNNHAYFPILLNDEDSVIKTVSLLAKKNIQVRRYFYPSLEQLKPLQSNRACPTSHSLSKRILCLPIWAGKPELNGKLILNEFIKASGL